MCTGIRLTTKQQSIIYARTLEFGIDLESQILYIPTGHEHASKAPDGTTNGLRWRSLYSVVGINAFGSPNFIDGVNQHGLAGGLFYFPLYAGYQTITPEHYDRSLAMWQLLTWLLTTCRDVSQVTEVIKTVYVTDIPFASMGSVPAHLVLHDASGASVVIEYINGVVHLHDNPLGVITNAPSFDWHMTNVNNYLALSRDNAAPKTVRGVKLHSFGLSSGLLGLPGDFTPPSRFIRAVAFSAAAPTFEHEQQAVLHAFHILNNFDIPYGIVRDDQGNTDHTLWTSAIDLKHRILYYKTYDNQSITSIDLRSITAHNMIMKPLQTSEQPIQARTLA